MKPERIEELARAACRLSGIHGVPVADWPMVRDATRTAIREFADEAVARVRQACDGDGVNDQSYAVLKLRDEVLGTIHGTTPGNPGESRGTE